MSVVKSYFYLTKYGAGQYLPAYLRASVSPRHQIFRAARFSFTF